MEYVKYLDITEYEYRNKMRKLLKYVEEAMFNRNINDSLILEGKKKMLLNKEGIIKPINIKFEDLFLSPECFESMLIEAIKDKEESHESNFRIELKNLLNRCSMENGSNTPDYLLADFLTNSLNNFDEIIKMRDQYYNFDSKISY